MKRLYRDRWNKKIAGVCGGLGQYFGVDPTLVRIALVLLTLFTGGIPLLIAYIVAWIVLPEGPSVHIDTASRHLYRSRTNRRLAGVCGGLARFLGIDPLLTRALFLIALILTGGIFLLLTYLAAVFIIPEEPAH